MGHIHAVAYINHNSYVPQGYVFIPPLPPLSREGRGISNPPPLTGGGRGRVTRHRNHWCISHKLAHMRLRLGTHIFRALPGNCLAFRPIMEAEPPRHAFPGGAWEREVWHHFFSILSFETASGGRSLPRDCEWDRPALDAGLPVKSPHTPLY
jgi:hypothetical protein